MKKRSISHHLQINIFVAAVVGGVVMVRAAEGLPKALFPGIVPVCPCESLTNLSLPKTRIESATLDPTNGWCRVTATVTHAPAAGDRVKIWIALPVTNWNGRFRGNGGGGYVGGSPASL